MFKLRNIFYRQRNMIVLLIFIALSSVSTMFSGEPVMEFASNTGLSLVSFFQGIATGVAGWFSDTVNSIGKIDQLTRELTETQNQLIEYQKASLDNVKLREENERLRSELFLIQQFVNTQYISVEVVAWASENDFSTLIVNKGELHGIVKDMPVVAFQKGTIGLVGKTIAVGLQSSVVRTILDPRSFVGALFKDTRYKGLVNGCGSLADYIEMDMVSKKAVEDLTSGTLVVTSGLGKLFPKDIPIGRWQTHYDAKDYESVVKLQINPVLDFRRLEYLYILHVEENK
ncbi:MAG: rod shape-determining protein MreC [Spirochaetaceae bacterium]|nr:MAG: rod shape-determining protein MreC [Spirochaetaceae bacterium]